MINLADEYDKIIAADPSRAGASGTNDVAEKSVRFLRDKKLKDSDWRMMPDVPSELKAGWETYRQALRDLPEQDGWPLDVIWPTEPS